MFSPRSLLLCSPVALLLGACASNPPLLFADSTTVGLKLGADTASLGGAVSLGVKNQSLAVVPVSVVDQSAQAFRMIGQAGAETDALSVFAVFKADAENKDSPVKIGQVFSTGAAAQLITQGFECHLATRSPCPASPDLPVPAAQPKTVQKDKPAETAEATGTATPASESTDKPYQRPLVYARTDTYGVDISGSTAEQGSNFTLGYGNRNLALVPIVAVSGAGRPSNLLGGDGKTLKDAYSVLGQFSANTETKRLGFGLERYFATGIAAQNLAGGLRAAIAATPAKPAAAP